MLLSHCLPPQEYGVVVEDLRICSVKLADDLERRFCFEVVTPTRTCMLQADTDSLRRRWCSFLEAGIARALRGSASNRVSVRIGRGDYVMMVTDSDDDGSLHFSAEGRGERETQQVGQYRCPLFHPYWFPHLPPGLRTPSTLLASL